MPLNCFFFFFFFFFFFECIFTSTPEVYDIGENFRLRYGLNKRLLGQDQIKRIDAVSNFSENAFFLEIRKKSDSNELSAF